MRRRNSHSTTSDVEQVLELCRADASPPAWLEVLRAAKPEIADAMRAQPLTVEVRLRGRRPTRLAISASGQVICPGGARDRPDVRLEGEASEVVAFLLGELSLIEAQRRGLLVLLTRVPPDRLGELRRIVGRQLRSLTSGPMAVLTILAPALWRVRRWTHGSIEMATAAADKAAPAVIAAVAALGGLSQASATQIEVTTTAPVLAASKLGSVPVTDGAAIVAQAAGNQPHTSTTRSDPITAPRVGGPKPAAVSAAIGRDEDSIHTNVENEDDGGRGQTWWWVRCDIDLRAAACDALGGLPTPGRLP